MAIRIVRLGTPRDPAEGPRLGTVRRPPRGVRKEEYGRQDYFDIWLPDLAPSTALVSYATSRPFTPARWRTFAHRYRAELRQPAAQRWLATLAVLSSQADFAVGCYCADESRCHRVLLRELLVANGAIVL